MQPWSPEALRNRLDRCILAGRLDGLEVEYWIGGGLPPPYYRSDQFRMLTADGRELLELARPVYDEAFRPYPIDKRQLPAGRDDVVAIADALKGLFADPPEPPELPADALRAEVLVTEGDLQTTLVLPVPVPPSAQPLHDAVAQRLARVEATGQRSLCHQGKPIA